MAIGEICVIIVIIVINVIIVISELFVLTAIHKTSSQQHDLTSIKPQINKK